MQYNKREVCEPQTLRAWYACYQDCMEAERQRFIRVFGQLSSDDEMVKRFAGHPWERFEAIMFTIAKDPKRLNKQMNALRAWADECGVPAPQ